MKRLWMFWMVSLALIGFSGCGGGGSENSLTTISGVVAIDSPLQGAKVEIYRVDGTKIDGYAQTDSEGFFKIKLQDSIDVVILHVQQGVLDNADFNGDLYAVCTKENCNITPLSTIAYSYFTSLLSQNTKSSYKKTLNDLKQILGLNQQDFQSFKISQNFNIAIYKQKIQLMGNNTLIASILTDISDGYIDEYKTIFPNASYRKMEPIISQYEEILDNNGNPISLTVSGIDGSQMGRDYLVDSMATRKITIIDDDYKEVQEDDVVLLSFNLGKWKNILSIESTVLAKLFMSDMDLLLLPNASKLQLIAQLKEKYPQSYKKSIELYEFIIQNGHFYDPLFENQLKELVGNAQTILFHRSREKVLNLRTLQQKTLIKKMYQTEKQKKFIRDYKLNSNLSIDYDPQNKAFSIKNNLPIYYGLRQSKNEYTLTELFSSPLIEPSELGAAGILASQSDLLTSILKYTLNKKAIQDTNLTGEQFDISLFPYAGATPNKGRREYEFYHEFSLNMPTVLNVSLGVKAILHLASGTAAGTFERAMNSITYNAKTMKKAFTLLHDGLNLADSFIEFLSVLLVDSNKEISKMLVEQKREINTAKILIASIKNILPSPTETVVKNKAGWFLTKVKVGEKNNVPIKGSAVWEIYNHHKDGRLTNKETLKALVIGKILGSIIDSYKINDLRVDHYLYKSELDRELREFERDFGITIKDYAYFVIYSYIKKNDASEIIFFNNISNKIVKADQNRIQEANKKYMEIIVKLYANNPNKWKELIANSVKIFIKPVDAVKILTKIRRMSINDVTKSVMDLILDETSRVAGNAFKSIIANAVKQAAYALTGSKIIQAAGAANEIAGIGWGLAATPSVVPFAINVEGKKIVFEYPSIKVIGAENSIIPIDSKEVLSEDDESPDYNIKSSSVFLFLSEKKRNNSFLIVTSKDEYQPFYDLSYKILYNNPISQLKALYSRFGSNNAIMAHLSIRKYPNDNLDNQPVTFGSKSNEATWKISGNEASDFLKTYKNNTSVLDIIDVLKRQNATGLKWLLGLSDNSSTVVQNKTRGIFKEAFSYRIFEPNNSALSGKATKIDYFDRNIFKVANAKEMRKGLYFHKTQDPNYNAVTNLTGHAVTVIAWGFERELATGETVKFTKYEHLKIVDAIVTQYGEYLGFKSTEATLSFLLSMKKINYTTVASDALYSEPYKFIIKVSQSDFTDRTPDKVGNIVNGLDYDGDGISDYDEVHKYFTNPYSIDSDGDDINDWDELNRYNTNPYTADSDGDGLSDWQEINLYYSDPNNIDSSSIGDLSNIINILNPVISQNTISGKVTTSDGTPVPNITIKFEYISGDKSTFETDVTNIDGTYKIELSKEDFDHFKEGAKLVIYAYGDDYVPAIKEIEKVDGKEAYYVDLTIEPLKENEIILEIEPKLHHLGDSNYSGSPNSDFQRIMAEGTEFTKTFYIDWDKYENYQRAKITFEAKGVQKYNNKLYINDKFYTLKSSPYNGSYSTQEFDIDKAYYHFGENNISIKSGQDYSKDYDDFEFINIKITFLDPVTAPVPTAPIYRDREKEVVIDTINHHMWQDNIDAITVTRVYDEAVQYCQDLKFAGYDDWRLPDIFEISNIIDKSRYPTVMDAFEYTVANKYWLTFLLYLSPDDAEYFDASTGYVSNEVKPDEKSYNYFVRCIRDHEE